MSYDSIDFRYDSNGIRVQKNNINYYTNNGVIIFEKHDTKTIFYNYDQDGLTSIKIKELIDGSYVSSTYYVRKNLQGDIIELIKAVNYSIVIVAKYRYDAWGKCLVLNPNGTVNTDPAFIGNINPIRYRGYYYDTETGLYLVGLRYYDPEVGRWISPDDASVALGAGGI